MFQYHVFFALDSPLIVSPPDSQEVRFNNSAVFQCIVVGNPEPQITWLKDSERIGSSDRVEIASDGFQLTIYRTHPDDAGTYTCLTRNTVGQTSVTATLDVIGSNPSDLN